MEKRRCRFGAHTWHNADCAIQAFVSGLSLYFWGFYIMGFYLLVIIGQGLFWAVIGRHVWGLNLVMGWNEDHGI